MGVSRVAARSGIEVLHHTLEGEGVRLGVAVDDGLALGDELVLG